MEINEIKQRLSILQVLSHYKIQPDRHNQILCPFHQDDKPSCKIYPETNTYHCFACNATGDAIQFIQDFEKCTKHEAIKKAESFITPPQIPTPKPENPQPKPEPTEKPFRELFGYFKESILRSANAQSYCASRGLDYKTLEIGYNSTEKWNKLKQCLIFPLKDKAGNIVSLYGRRITDTSAGSVSSKGYALEYGKHYYSENRSGLYPNYPNPDTETLIITEAIIDAATLLQTMSTDKACLVSKVSTAILAAYGTNGFTKEHKAAISELKHLQEIVIFFDGDVAGEEAAALLAESLHELLPRANISTIDTIKDEDINSIYLKYGAETLLELINKRTILFPSIELSLTESQEPRHKSQDNETPKVQTRHALSPLDITTPNKITYQTPTARYIVKGTLCKQLDKMLVSLDVQHLETATKYRTRLDLYEEKQTRKEAREAAEKLDLRSDLIENDLSKLTDMLEELREKEFENLKMSQFENGENTVPFGEQAKCKDFLSPPDLIHRINELIGKSGIVGEENNRLFLFVIAVSHKMPDTLHALIQGSSGSGKTHLLSKIADLMPSERVVKFTRVTENSFYNYDEYFFKGKLICLEDIDGLKEEALFAWRELISNNQLSSSTSLKDENGNIRSAQRIVRGPMASICATTHGQIYEDNMSRLFIIAVDESNVQTARIMDYQKQKAAGLIDAAQEKETTVFLQNLVRMLKPCKVINPYANHLHLPPQAHKIRRLNELYLAFVKQITIINQYQRKKDEQGRIITEKEDLQTAVNIMFESIFLKIDELDGSLRQFFEQLKSYVEEKPNANQYEFTRLEIRQATGISNTGLHRSLNALIDLEYIAVVGGFQNRGLKYKISYWDNVAKLREQIKQFLLNQLDKL